MVEGCGEWLEGDFGGGGLIGYQGKGVEFGNSLECLWVSDFEVEHEKAMDY